MRYLGILVVLLGVAPASARMAHAQPVSMIMVRHAEADASQPTVPLTEAGRRRAQTLAYALQHVRFTHILGTHTIRTRQTVEAIAAAQELPVMQLPMPGSMLDGSLVTDQTSRRAAIEPVAEALARLPPGSMALAALNSENIYAILNRLGIPVAGPGQSCTASRRCVPCTDNSCYPRDDFDRMWHLVRDASTGETLAFVELRYGVASR